MTTAIATKPTGVKPPVVSTQQFDEMIRASNMRILFTPIEFGGEKMDVYRKPGFETACWAYQPPHTIMIGDGIFDRYVKQPTHGKDAMLLYLHAYNSHEHAHSKWTERNLQKVNVELGKKKIPFSLFNLFEDARIEHLWRLETKVEFEWLAFEANAVTDIPEADGPPQAGTWFFAFIQAEGKLTPKAARVTKSTVAERVYSFYERAILAKDSWALFPLMEEWLKEFPPPPPPPSGGGGNPGSGLPGASAPRDGLELGMALAADAKAMAEFLKDAKLVTDPDRTKEGKGRYTDPTDDAVPDNAAPVLGDERHFLKAAKTLNFERADKCAANLAKGFQVRKGFVPSAEPQKRIDARAYALGDDTFYRRKSVKRPGRKKGVLFMDCSGSMGDAIDEGIIIAATLSRLARKGLFEGYLVLTVGTPPKWLAYKFPVPDDKLRRLAGFGGAECIEHGIHATKHLWKHLDFAAFYTDANIVDTPIDKAALHALGIYTYGLYSGDAVGSESAVVKSMLRFFDKAIVRKNAEELTDALVLQLKATNWK